MSDAPTSDVPSLHRRAYAKAGWLRSPTTQDSSLVLALASLLALYPHGALALALAAAIPLAIAWSVLTLHLPRRVSVDDDSIAFAAYGREHRFAWRDIERIHVRRFLVQDRVLVRILPCSAWRGRYWLIDSLDGYDALVRRLEERAGEKRENEIRATRR